MSPPHSAQVFPGFFPALSVYRLGSSRFSWDLAGSRARENGIMVYIEFVSWDRIEAFEWVEGSGEFSTLRIQYRTQFPTIVRKVDLPVPMEKRGQLESLLEGHVPKRALGI